MIEKQGRLAEIIFRNEENFYTVAVIEDDENMEEYIAVGSIPTAKCGMTFSFTGDWKTHPTYGEQFVFSNCTEMIPRTTEGIREFLGSGIIKGVGPQMARAIVAKFGESTLEVIEKTPERLMSVSGIGKAKLKSITEAYRAHREFAEIAMFFSGYGIGAAHAMRMYKLYGTGTVRAVMKNPYRLISDIRAIGFAQADEIALRLGIERDSEFRIKSGIKFMLGRYIQSGHTYAPYKEFCEQTGAMLDIASADISDMAEQMVFEDQVRIEELEKQKVIYPSFYHEAECSVSKKLYALYGADVKPVKSDVDEMIMRSEADNGIRLSENQREAVKACCQNGVCVVTGGPGTGKTTIINTILDVFENSGFSVGLSAPTGRAAKRMTETSGRPAVTIHRLLEYYHSTEDDEMNFGRTSENPLEQDVIIVDEMSMVDILLMDALTEAIVTGTRLVMVGDADQLPSVGAGNVLRDIIASELIPTVKLTEIFRQAEESMIVVNAHRINSGEYPYCNEKDKDFFLMKRSSESAILGTILELCKTRLPGFYTDCEPVRDIQVLTPVRKGTLGIHNLNRELQRILNPSMAGKTEKEIAGRIFRKGDKVMQIKNNYDLEWKRKDNFADGQGVFNGDIGFIVEVDNEDHIITVVFDEVKYARYDFTLAADELELAYAMTIHKSQGSEFPVIVMPMAYFPPVLATRNLLYTGVTRGKRGVVLVGAENMLHGMVDNNRIDRRNSGLAARLRGLLALENL